MPSVDCQAKGDDCQKYLKYLRKREPLTSHTKLSDAIVCATRWHGEQLDKRREPYIFQPINVMLRIAKAGHPIEMQIAAVLHDVVEDCGIRLHMIENLFGKDVSGLLDSLSRRVGESYFDYIARVADDLRAAKIKIVDLEENLREDRHISTGKSLKDRYRKALEILQGKRED